MSPAGCRQAACTQVSSALPYLVAVKEHLVRLTVAVAGSTYAKVLHQTQISYLVAAEYIIPGLGRFCVVGFDATDVKRILALKRGEFIRYMQQNSQYNQLQP